MSDRVLTTLSPSGGKLGARLRNAVLEALSPTRCAACERPGDLLCSRCRDALTCIDPALACSRCGAPFGSMLCTECRGEDTPLDRCLAAAVFDEISARTVRAYKDGGERRLAGVIAELLAEAAQAAEYADAERYGGLLSSIDAVAFVPATASAFRRRGFDHMEAVARAFCEQTGIPLLDALAKRGRADQRDVGRTGRREQARDAYEVVDDIAGLRLLLLDDVITTGATITAAATALKRAGATNVDALALARVWG